MIVIANEVKTKGVSLFDSLLQKVEEVVINVRGKNRFVVMDIERYKELRALELDRAHELAMEDIKAGRYKTLSSKEHIEEMMRELEDEVSDSSN